MSSLRSKISRNRHLEIRPARNDDWLAIERLLSYADRHYLALEWWTIQEWLGSPTFLLATDPNERCVGLMLTVIGDGPVGWLRTINVFSDDYLAPLLEASVQATREQGATGFAFLGNEGWLVSKLRQADFGQVNRVVTLRRRGLSSVQHGPPGLQVRAATAADIDAILAVDHASFTPIWWYSSRVLRRALNVACSFDVAYMEGQCVGYQLSTLRSGRGHIVRLATHPRWQRRGIGSRLLSVAMKALDAVGAQAVTVNTQEKNLASLQLYRRFSFEPNGIPLAVWFSSFVNNNVDK